MKNNFRKALSLVLTVLMVMAVVPFTGLAACDHVFDGDLFDRVSGQHAYWCSKCNLVYGNGDTEGTVACSGGTATCKEAATCTVCKRTYGEKNTNNHIFSAEVATEDYLANEATCVLKAEYYYSCSLCGISEENDSHTFFDGKTDLVKGHKAVDGVYTANNNDTHTIAECEICGHTNITVDCSSETEATCTAKAKCDFCKAEFGELAEHDYGTFTKDDDADTHTKTCKNCPATKTEACTGGEADCDTLATCEVCGGSYGEVKHTWNEGEVTTPATCSAIGVKTFTCTAEGCTATKTEDIAIDENAHKYGETLNKAENNQHYVVCEYNAEHKKYTGCTTNSSSVTEPGCETEGYTTYTCLCGNTWKGAATEATGHSFEAEIVEEKYLKDAATCISKAVYYKSCSVCGAAGEETFETGEVAPHAYTEKLVDEAHLSTKATCLKEAEYWYDCATCDANAKNVDTTNMKEEEIAALKFKDGEKAPHTYIKEITDNEEFVLSAPTCTVDGIYWYACAEEGCTANAKNEENAEDNPAYYYVKTGSAKGHTVVSYEGKEPTCTEDGYTDYKQCSVCEVYTKAKVERKAAGHKEYISVEKQEATCTRVGKTEEKKCAVCEQLLSLPSMTTNALGHTDEDGDEICDRAGCGTIVSGDEQCGCLCHSTGIMRVIYVLVKLIWKLIGASKYCDCGIEHY